MSQFKNKLLNKTFMKDVVRADIFCHEQQVLADVAAALDAGLRPVSFSLIEQEDGYAVMLRLERPEAE